MFPIGPRGAADVSGVGGGSLSTKAFDHHSHPAHCATQLLIHSRISFTLNGRGGENMEDEISEL